MATFLITTCVILLTLGLIAYLAEKRAQGGERSAPPAETVKTAKTR